MPFVPSVAKANNIRKATIPYAGQELTIWYRPDAITPARLEEMSAESDAVKQASADGEKVEADNQLVSMIIEFVSKWDVAEPRMNGHSDDAGNVLQAVGPDGEPLWDVWPVDRAHVRRLSVPAQLAVVDGMVKDFQPGEKNASGSFTG